MKLVLFLLFALAGIKSSVGTAYELTIAELEAKHLPPTDGIGDRPGDAYVIIKQRKDSKTNQLHITYYISYTPNPFWDFNGPTKITADYVDDRDNDLIFEVWDKDSFSKDDFYGTYTVPAKDAVVACGRKLTPATNPPCQTQGGLKGGYGIGLFIASYRITHIFGSNNRQDCGNGTNPTCGGSSFYHNQIKLSYQLSGVLTLCYLLSTLQLKLNY